MTVDTKGGRNWSDSGHVLTLFRFFGKNRKFLGLTARQCELVNGIPTLLKNINVMDFQFHEFR